MAAPPLSIADLGQWLVELGERGLGIALVELVDRAIVAQSPSDERVGAELLGRACEQRVGFGIAAEVRLLQRFVGKRFGAAERRVAEPADGGEEFGGFGIAAGIVAAIGFGERRARIERSRLDAREGGGIAGARRRDRDLALDRLVGDEAAQAELERAVVAAEAFGGVELLPCDS